jgi:hypothetical protein
VHGEKSISSYQPQDFKTVNYGTGRYVTVRYMILVISKLLPMLMGAVETHNLYGAGCAIFVAAPAPG